MNTRRITELLNEQGADEFLATYSVWESGKDRFAITPGHQVVPVLGYVTRKSEHAWFAESHGRVLPMAYPSLMQAARALANSGD
ncbi:MAG TPA: hypothetical protein VKG79_13670 [Bryobacteraceae bacterium]|nr:hypothetical protein [Bryobacteraceae bacterium]